MKKMTKTTAFDMIKSAIENNEDRRTMGVQGSS